MYMVPSLKTYQLTNEMKTLSWNCCVVKTIELVRHQSKSHITLESCFQKFTTTVDGVKSFWHQTKIFSSV